MSHGTFTTLLRHIHKLTGTDPAADPGSSQLLERFAASRDEAAFTELVRRHGPLVWSVCRRVLTHDHDAEDAFQATFLVLARKAASLRHRGALGGWLHRVAYHIAIQARTDAARRRQQESRTPTRESSEPAGEVDRHELGTVLNEELSRLPEKHRAPLVLCYFEGKTHQEAAVVLGWPAGSMSWRVSKALDLLRSRLSRRGVALPGTALAAALAESAATAAPAALVQTTVKVALLCAAGESAATEGVPATAAALAAGMLRGMWLTKMKVTAAVVLVVGLLGGGAGVLLQRSLAERHDGADDTATAKAPAGKVETLARLDLHGDPLPPGALARLGTVRLRHSRKIIQLAFSPDGRTLTAQDSYSSGSGITAIRLWDTATGQELRRIEGKRVIDSGRYPLCMSPDGRTVALKEFDKDGHCIVLREIATDREVRRFRADALQAEDLWTFSSDDQLLMGPVMISANKFKMRSWKIATGEELPEIEWSGKAPSYDGYLADGRLIAISEGMISLWDVRTAKRLRQWKVPDERIDYHMFSPDGQFLLTVSVGSSAQKPDGRIEWTQVVRLWDPATGRERGQWPINLIERRRIVAVFPDSKALLICHGDELTLCDPFTGKELRRLGIRVLWVKAVAFAAGGKQLATGSEDGCVQLWDLATGMELLARDSPSNWLTPTSGNRLTPSHDGKFVMTTDRWGTTLSLWNLADGKPLASLRSADVSPDGTVRGIIVPSITSPTSRGQQFAAVSPDGTILAQKEDKVIHLLEAASRRELGRIPTPAEKVWSLAFSPNARLLACQTAEEVRVWRVPSGKELHCFRFEKRPEIVFFSPDSRILAWSGWSEGDGNKVTSQFWDLATGRRLPDWTDGSVTHVHFTPDSRKVVSLTETGIVVWDVAAGKETRKWPRGQKSSEIALSVLPDGRLATFCMVGEQGAVRLWDLETGKASIAISESQWRSWLLVFSPDGRTLVSGGQYEDTVRLWEVATGKERYRLTGHQAALTDAVFTPDGRTLITSSRDTTALVWDLTGLRKDGQMPPLTLAPEELEAHWKILAGEDAAQAYRSHWRLAAAPSQTLAFLETRLRPRLPVDSGRLVGLIRELENNGFAVREKASGELERLGELAVPALRNALKENPTLDLRQRVERLLARAEDGHLAGERLREARAVEVLERIGTAEAQALLEKLAKGADGARLTQDARASLTRLTRPSSRE